MTFLDWWHHFSRPLSMTKPTSRYWKEDAGKRVAVSPPWSKVKSWDRAETETGPYQTLPIRKSWTSAGAGGWGGWVESKNWKMPVIGIMLGLWYQETGYQSQLCLLIRSLPFSHPFPSVIWGGWLCERRVCSALTAYSGSDPFPASSCLLEPFDILLLQHCLFCFLSEWLFLTLSRKVCLH